MKRSPKGHVVYTVSGKVSHRLLSGSPNGSDPTLCGLSPWPLLWRGGFTSPAWERRKADGMPRCKNCWKDWKDD
jgi:hypothetical protein